MSASTPATGTIVFDRSGHEAEYVSQLPNGCHLVRPGHVYYSGDPEAGEEVHYKGVAEWHEVFLKPPVEKLNAEVAELKRHLDLLQSEIGQLRKVKREKERDIAARKDRLKQHEALRQLDDYLANRITHFVVLSRGYSRDNPPAITIETFKDAMEQKEAWSRGQLKCLSLFGDTKGDLTFGINDYSCCNGDDKLEVVPCTSLEQAREIAIKHYEAELAAWRAQRTTPEGQKPARRVWCPETVVGHAIRLEQPVPQDAVDAVAARKLTSATSAVEAARKALLKAEADLAAVQMGLPVSAENVACAPMPA